MRRSVSTFLVAAVLAACSPSSHADTITTFNVSGTAYNIAEGPFKSSYCPPGGTPCSFSGTLTVDVTVGKIRGIDVTFPSFTPFDVVSFSAASAPSDWVVSAEQGPFPYSGRLLTLDFTTASTPSSLVGFDGGSIFGGSAGDTIDVTYYSILTGSITVPEPGSLVLMLAGLSALGLFAMRRRRAALGNR